MCAEDIHTALHWLRTDVKKDNRLLHIDGVDLVPCLELGARRNHVCKVAVARRLRQTYRLRHALVLQSERKSM